MVLSALQHFRDAEVTQLNGVVFGEENILGFQVSMKDLAAVNVFERETELNEPVHDFRLSERLVLGLLLSHMIGQIAVLAKLHYDNQNTLFDERVLVWNDVRVVQLPQQISLNGSEYKIYQ